MASSAAPPVADPPTPAWLTPLLSALCLAALLAAARALLLPPWPRVRPLPQAQVAAVLQHLGLQPRPLPAMAPRRSSERALASAQRWRLANGTSLTLIPVAIRRWPDWQLASFTAGLSTLALRERRASPQLPGTASGLLQGRPALQTCLVPQPAGPALAGFTRQQLKGLLQRAPNSFSRRLSSLIGLQPSHRLTCTLVSLQASSATAPADLAPTWRRLVPALAGLPAVSNASSSTSP